MSIYKPGGKTVNVFARDAESLRADPPKFATTFTGSGIEKFEKLVKTGAPQEFDTHELGAMRRKRTQRYAPYAAYKSTSSTSRGSRQFLQPNLRLPYRLLPVKPTATTKLIPGSGSGGGSTGGGSTGSAAKKWKLGSFKSAQKWVNQMAKRGWTPDQIDEAIEKGARYKAVNNVNPANTATRYVNPSTGRSVVIDDVTNEVLHVGGDGFRY